MLKLMRIVGGAVIMGMGYKAGSDLYEVLRDRARRARGDAARDVTLDAEPAGEAEDPEAAEARLEAERARIERELERLRRKRARRS